MNVYAPFSVTKLLIKKPVTFIRITSDKLHIDFFYPIRNDEISVYDSKPEEKY